LLNVKRGSALTDCVVVALVGFFDKLVNRGKRNVDSGALAALQECEAKDFGGPVSSYSLKSYALHRV
jgi:queuine/archaeosine tRNA-ribosyltransferase